MNKDEDNTPMHPKLIEAMINSIKWGLATGKTHEKSRYIYCYKDGVYSHTLKWEDPVYSDEQRIDRANGCEKPYQHYLDKENEIRKAQGKPLATAWGSDWYID